MKVAGGHRADEHTMERTGLADNRTLLGVY